MGAESIIGKIARFWGPANSGTKPDVEGRVTDDRGGGRVVVDENGERVTVNMHGGWLRMTFQAVVLVTLLGSTAWYLTNGDYA